MYIHHSDYYVDSYMNKNDIHYICNRLFNFY